GGQAQSLDHLRIARAAGDGARTRVRDVSEQRPEADDQLDVELLDEADDQVGERTPAQVRFDPEQKHDIALQARRPPVVEDGRGPVDAARDAVLERDVRPGRLEVEEVFRLDLREAPRVPELCEVPGRERSALAAVVPAAKGSDQHRMLELWAARDEELL